MSADPERVNDAWVPVHFPPQMTRCPEVLRGELGGYERCHRAEHDGGEHHVRGRAWTGRQATGTVRLRFGAPCGPGCAYPDETEVWGSRAGPGGAKARPPGRTTRLPPASRKRTGP